MKFWQEVSGLLWFGGNIALKATLLLLLTWGAVVICRRASAACRHALWFAGLFGILRLPLAAIVLPAWPLFILPGATASAPPGLSFVGSRRSDRPDAVPESITTTAVLSETGRILSAGEKGHFTQDFIRSAAESNFVTGTSIRQNAERSLRLWPALLGSIWMIGALACGTDMTLRLWQISTLYRTSLPIADNDLNALMNQVREQFSLRRSIELREHRGNMVPLTWGLLRPVIVLPVSARNWDRSLFRMVLLHEIAHIHRWDAFSQLVGRFVCALYWFHPLAWFSLQRLRQEREHACDDAVLGRSEKASDYAEQLLKVARHCQSSPNGSLVVAMTGGSQLEKRIHSLFDSTRSHKPLAPTTTLLLLLTGALLVGTVSTLKPTAAAAAQLTDSSQGKNSTEQSLPSSDGLSEEKQREGAVADGPVPKEFIIHGQVIDMHGNPVPRACVIYQGWFDGAQWPSTHTETDEGGKFRLAIPSKLLGEDPRLALRTVWAWQNGYSIGTAGIPFPEKSGIGEIEPIHIVLPPPHSNESRILDPSGQPVANAKLVPFLMRVPNGDDPVDGMHGLYEFVPQKLQDQVATRSNADGRVVLDSVPESQIDRVSVTTDQFGEQHFGAPYKELRLSAVGAISGEIKGIKESTFISLEHLKSRDSDPSAKVLVRTDDQGRFHVPVFPTGQTKIRMLKQSGPQLLPDAMLQIIQGENRVSLEMLPGIPVKGRMVVKGASHGVPRARFSLRTHCEMYGMTDENGEFTIDTLPGEATFQVYVLNPVPSLVMYPPLIRFQVPADAEQVTVPDIELDPARRWNGTLVDEDDQPVTGVYVFPASIDDQRIGLHRVRTDRNGKFQTLLNAEVVPDGWGVVWKWNGEEVKTRAFIISESPLILQTTSRQIDKR